MTTRVRAIIIATITTLLVFIGLSGLVDYQNLLSAYGIENEVITEFIVAAAISLVLTLGTWWTLYFKRKGLSLFLIGTFPGVAVFPFLLLFVSIISSIFSGLGQLAIALISAIIYWLVVYFLILTANVLNGSILYEIPLGQAGKAAQFIFALVSSYFLIALLFGAAFPVELRIGLIGFFVFYFSFTTIWTLKVPLSQVWLSSIAISVIMMLATLLLTIWPIESIYATLTLVVLLYIMLNVALEMRQKVGRMIWIEYVVLVVMVIIILFTNGSWGINGTIF